MIRLSGVSKRFGSTLAVDHFSVDVADGELLVILGPSGCGKSTILRLITGLETPDVGTIELNGRNIVNELAHKRDVALVFQFPQFLPHRSVAQNIAYPLVCKKQGWWNLIRGNITNNEAEVVTSWARKLSIEHLLDRDPATLSGGELQRMSLARALTKQAGALLLDEPLTNVDARLRDDLLQELITLKELAIERKVSIIYVTHDQEDALVLGDRILVMENGRLQQIGTPGELYHNPDNLFVATFLGKPRINVIPATLSFARDDIHPRITFLGLDLPIERDRLRKPLPKSDKIPILAAIRPEDIRILGTVSAQRTAEYSGDASFRLNARVLDSSNLGNHFVVRLEVADHTLSVFSTHDSRNAPETHAEIEVRTNSVLIFDSHNRERLV